MDPDGKSGGSTGRLRGFLAIWVCAAPANPAFVAMNPQSRYGFQKSNECRNGVSEWAGGCVCRPSADTVRSPTGLSAATGWRGLCQCLGGSWVVGQPAKQSRRPRPFPRHKAREQRRRDVGMRDTYGRKRANKDGAPSGRNGMWLMMPGQPDPIRSRNVVRSPASSLRPREVDQFATDTFGAMVCRNEQSKAGADFCLLVGTDVLSWCAGRGVVRQRNPALETIQPSGLGPGGCGPGWSLDSPRHETAVLLQAGTMTGKSARLAQPGELWRDGR